MFMYKMALTTSPTTWTSGSLFGTDGSGIQVVYGNGTYVAIGTGTNLIYYSTNGQTWTGVSSPLSLLAFTAKSLAFHNNKWVLVGTCNKLGDTIYYSTNGSTWTAVSGHPFGLFLIGERQVGGTFVKFTGGYWYACGWTSIIDPSNQGGGLPLIQTVILYSADGITWANAISVNNNTNIFDTEINGLDYGNGRLVVVGKNSFTSVGLDLGIYYSNLPVPPFLMSGIALSSSQLSGGYKYVLTNGDNWVAIGSTSNSPTENVIKYSVGAPITWITPSTNPFSQTGSVSAGCVSFNSNTWVIGSAAPVPAAYSLDNGITWSGITSSVPNSSINSVVFANTKWVVGGVDSSGNNIAYSSDGVTWSNSITGGVLSPGAINSITYGPGRWVAVGNGSNQYTSTDQNTTYSNVIIYEPPPCFLEDSKILTENGYVKVQNLRPGDKVKTIKNGFVPVHCIGSKTFYHPNTKERTKDQLYVCSPKNYPEMTEDLVITGCHSVLVDNFKSYEQKDEVVGVLGNIYMTDGYFRLPSCVDERSEVYDKVGDFTVYHFALENEDYYMNYGVYANGLLVETTSKRYLLEVSGMKLIEN